MSTGRVISSIHLKFFLYIDGYFVEIHMGYKYFHTSCWYREVYPYVSLQYLLNTFPVVFILVPFRHPFTKWLATTNESQFPKPGFNSMWTVKFQMFKLNLEKAEEPEIKLPTSIESYKKQENSRKTSTSVSLTMWKPLTVWITTNCGKFLKRWEYQTTSPASWETCMQVKNQELELDMEQQTGSK